MDEGWSWKIGDCQGYARQIMEEYDDGNTAGYGRFQGAGGAGSVRGHDPGDCSKHKVHPNQVPGDVFSGGADRARSDHGSEIKELHAKIGELTVVMARGLSDEPGGPQGHDAAIIPL